MPSPFLSIIIPAYNESFRIKQTLRRVAEYLAHKKYSYEIIVANDGSDEVHSSLLNKYIQGIPNLRVINIPHGGKGAAVRAGMLEASGTFRVFTDADNSVDISYADVFITACQNGYDMAMASVLINSARKVGFDPLYRQLLGVVSRTLVYCVIGSRVKDTQRGFKMFTAKAADLLFNRQTVNGFGFDIEIIAIAQAHELKIKELPIQWNNSPESKVNLLSYLKTLAELAHIGMNKFRDAYNR